MNYRTILAWALCGLLIVCGCGDKGTSAGPPEEVELSGSWVLTVRDYSLTTGTPFTCLAAAAAGLSFAVEMEQTDAEHFEIALILGTAMRGQGTIRGAKAEFAVEGSGFGGFNRFRGSFALVAADSIAGSLDFEWMDGEGAVVCAGQEQFTAVKRDVRPTFQSDRKYALAESHLTPSGHYRLHYDLSGEHAVDSADGDGNGIPDYVEAVAQAADYVWRLMIDELGYQAPPLDRGAGGGDEYDVYIVELGKAGMYGSTYPEVFEGVAYSYMEVDNNYTDPVFATTRGLEALQVTLAHNLATAVARGYYQSDSGIWWETATATWMEEVAYPGVDDYLQYLDAFLRQPARSIDSAGRDFSDFYLYGTCLFAHFLDQRFERRLVRAIWEELFRTGNARLENFDRLIPGGLAQAMSEFAVWNYFTGSRYRPGFYREGQQYPEAPVVSLLAEGKAADQASGQVDHLGSVYFQLIPQARPGGVAGGVRVESGAWKKQLVLISSDSVQVEAVEGDSLRLSNWDRYEEIVLVLTAAELAGTGYPYTVAVNYDPNLTVAAGP